jgi:hypothetical protein
MSAGIGLTMNTGAAPGSTGSSFGNGADWNLTVFIRAQQDRLSPPVPLEVAFGFTLLLT